MEREREIETETEKNSHELKHKEMVFLTCARLFFVLLLVTDILLENKVGFHFILSTNS